MDWLAITLTLKLALVSTLILLLLGTPLAWWLARRQGWWVSIVNTLVTLPVVLPPTVIGFYLLLLLSPQGSLANVAQLFGLTTFAFSFTGLVIGSVIYSLPFVVQPLVNGFAAIPHNLFEVAATLGATPLQRFTRIALPLAKPGFVVAFVLGFAHTLGEFGVVLMIGGNIPGETRVVSIAIYEQVESLQWGAAHQMSLLMLLFAFVVILITHRLQKYSALGLSLPVRSSKAELSKSKHRKSQPSKADYWRDAEAEKNRPVTSGSERDND